MITADKLLGYPERIKKDKRPITADVFLTRRCNNACGYCTYTRHMRRNGAEMSAQRFSEALDRLIQLGVQGVILTGGGEPTVARCFDEVASMLEEKGMPYGINTNYNVYKECRPVYLKVSLDGWDEDSYKAERGVAQYGTVRENVTRYYSWKLENSPKTRVVLQMVAKDAKDVERFYSANMDLPCDCIVFRPVESRLGEWYGYESPKDVIEAVKSIHDPRVILNPKFWQISDKFGRCTANHCQIAVDEQCNVIYCCHKPYEIVGSLFDDDILEKKELYDTDMTLCDVPCRLTASNLVSDTVAKMETATDKMFI